MKYLSIWLLSYLCLAASALNEEIELKTIPTRADITAITFERPSDTRTSNQPGRLDYLRWNPSPVYPERLHLPSPVVMMRMRYGSLQDDVISSNTEFASSEVTARQLESQNAPNAEVSSKRDNLGHMLWIAPLILITYVVVGALTQYIAASAKYHGDGLGIGCFGPYCLEVEDEFKNSAVIERARIGGLSTAFLAMFTSGPSAYFLTRYPSVRSWQSWLVVFVNVLLLWLAPGIVGSKILPNPSVTDLESFRSTVTWAPVVLVPFIFLYGMIALMFSGSRAHSDTV